MARKKDERGRRQRHTLTVDLGLEGAEQLKGCQETINSWRKAAGCLDLRPRTLGEVVKVAIRCLAASIAGHGDPLRAALGSICRRDI